MTDQPNQPEARLDMNECERVDQTINRLMDTSPPNIGWMSSELAHKLLSAHSGARTLMMMSLLRTGMPKEQAEQQADMQAPLLLFDLGLRVGKGLAAGADMDAMLSVERPITAEQFRYLDVIAQWKDDEVSLMFGPPPDSTA